MTGDDRGRDLVRRAIGGEKHAFDELLRDLEPDLRSVLRGLLRTAPDLSVEDALQDVRVYLFERLDRYDSAYPLGAFARGLARNVVKRLLHGRRDLLPPGGPESDGDDPADLSPMELRKLPLDFRRAMGEGRFEAPDGETGPSRTFLEMLEVFLLHGGYPHQQVAFGFGVLLWGRAKRRAGTTQKARTQTGPAAEKVPVTGDPDRVVREVGPSELDPSAGRMLQDLEEVCRLDSAYVRRVRRPLDGRLAMTGEELFARDLASARRHAPLLPRRIGGTRLEEYFGDDPRRSVSDWTHGVKARVRKALLEPELRGRSPLPGPRESAATGRRRGEAASPRVGSGDREA